MTTKLYNVVAGVDPDAELELLIGHEEHIGGLEEWVQGETREESRLILFVEDGLQST